MKLSGAVSTFIDSMTGIKAANTVLWYQRRLVSLVEYTKDKDLESVTLGDLRAWRGSLANRKERYTGASSRPAEAGALSPWTVHSYMRAARRFFRFALDEGLVSANPAKRLELPKLPATPRKGIAEADLAAMIAAAKAEPRDYALVLFLADSLCRVGGVVGLKVADLDLEHCRALVREKGDKSRMVFLSPPTCEAMRAWLAVRPAGPGQVFTGQRGPLKHWGIYIILRKLAEKAGVTENWNPHSFRHGGARGMLARGANLAQVSQILGHSDVSVTARHYGSFAESELQNAHDKFSWLQTPGE